eukprot:10701856-Lingulodinium_polyedra.AAC.1
MAPPWGVPLRTRPPLPAPPCGGRLELLDAAAAAARRAAWALRRAARVFSLRRPARRPPDAR